MCGKLVGPGAVQFQCREASGHDGPCACPEVGASNVARQRWLADNPPPLPAKIVQSYADEDDSQGVLPPLARRFEDRLSEVYASIRFSPGDTGEGLPPNVKSWMMGGAAQLSLVDLWKAWTAASEGGSPHLTLDGAQVERLVPPALRIT
jgi:hypothetical protein